MKATLTFLTRQVAGDFATAWSRKTLKGHTMGSGLENVKVTVYDISGNEEIWIDNYVDNLNNQ